MLKQFILSVMVALACVFASHAEAHPPTPTKAPHRTAEQALTRWMLDNRRFERFHDENEPKGGYYNWSVEDDALIPFIDWDMVEAWKIPYSG